MIKVNQYFHLVHRTIALSCPDPDNSYSSFFPTKTFLKAEKQSVHNFNDCSGPFWDSFLGKNFSSSLLLDVDDETMI